MNYPLIQRFLALHRRVWLRLLFSELVGSALTLALPLLVAQAYADSFGFQSMRGRLLEKMGWSSPFEPNWLLVLAIAITLKALFDYWRKWVKGWLMETFLFWLREQLFSHHLRLSSTIYEQQGTSKYLMRFSGDLSSAQQLLSKGIIQFFADASLLGLGALLMLGLDWRLGLFVLLISTLAGVIIAYLNQRVERIETQRRDARSGLLSFVNQRLSHIYTLKAFNRATPELQRFSKRNQTIQNLGLRYQRQVAYLGALIPWFVYLVLLLILVLAQFGRQYGIALSQDTLFALILILLTWKPVFHRVLQVGLIWKKGKISLNKLQQLLALPVEPSLEQAELDFRARTLRIEYPEKTILMQRGDRQTYALPAYEQQRLVKALAALEGSPQLNFYLDDHLASTLPPKIIRKQFSFISPLFPLYGKDLLAAIAYSPSPRHTQPARELFMQWQTLFSELQGLSLHTPIMERKALTPAQLQLLQWLCAFLRPKSFLILHNADCYLSPGSIQKLQELTQQHLVKPGILTLIEAD